MTRKISIAQTLVVSLALATAAMMWAGPGHAERLPLNTIGGPAGVDAVRTPIGACGTIDAPGSYVVIKNLAAVGTCLNITADNVTIDLNGFVLSGDGTGSGIGTNGTLANPRLGIAVHHGTVTGFDDGINFFRADSSAVVGVRATNNTGNGIQVGSVGTVRNSTAHGNGFNGIIAGSASKVTGNSATDNDNVGITAEANSTVTGNTVRGNGQQGFVVECPLNLIGNTSTGNRFDNLFVFGGDCNIVKNIAP